MFLYRFWQWKLGWLLRRRARVAGLEFLPTRSGFLIAANHIDFLDGALLSAVLWPQIHRRIIFLSRTANYWLFGSPTIPVSNGNRAEALTRARRVLDQGEAVFFFIEGERNPTDVLLRPKTGVARLALQSGAPIVPIGLRGPSHGSFLASLFKTRGVEVWIGEPIAVQKDPREVPERVQMLTREVAEAVARLSGKSFPIQH